MECSPLPLLLLLLLFASVRCDHCPERCECSEHEAHCSRAGLSDFPAGLDGNTTYLDVGHNRLTAIADDQLADLGLTALTSLICDNNSIETVGEHAFRGLLELSLIQLSGNRIRTLHPQLFVGNPVIRHVDLTDNPLQLAEEGPVLVAPSLEWLDLDHCNLTSLPKDGFLDLRNLRYLNLNGNGLHTVQLPVLSGLSYLRYLKMAGNPIFCDCGMKPLWRWLSQQKISVDARCVAPGNRSVQSWNMLDTLECETEQ